MAKYNFLLMLPLISLSLSATETDTTSPKNDDVKFAIEVGSKGGFWNPGLSGNVLNYETEGLYLGYGKLKLKLYDSDVLTLEKYGTLTSGENQSELLAQYKDDRKHDSSLDGIKISIQLMKVINYLFDKEWLTGLNYEYNTKNFIGDATLEQTSKYWYGNLHNGKNEVDFSRLKIGQRLAFKTKFTSHKLSYRFENILKNLKGSYISTGIFDQEWSKPTFVGDTDDHGEEPIIFDSNYYSKGLSGAIGMVDKSYDIKAYFDYGVDNEMKIIQKGDNYSDLNKDIDVYTMGLKADYRFIDVYSTDMFATDIIVGAGMQYNKITQNGSIDLDAETLYGVNAGIEVVF